MRGGGEQSARARTSGRVLLFGGNNVSTQELLALISERELDLHNQTLYGDVIVPLEAEDVCLRITALKNTQETHCTMAEVASFLQYVRLERDAPALIVLCVRLAGVHLEDEEAAVEEYAQMRADLSTGTRAKIGVLFLDDHAHPTQYALLRENHETLPDIGTVATGTRQSLVSALKDCIAQLRRPKSPSDVLPPLSDDLKQLLEKDNLILNSLLPGDVSSVLTDQFQVVASTSAVIDSSWEKNRLQKVTERLLSSVSSLTDVPFTEAEARQFLSAVASHLEVPITFVGMSRGISPPPVQAKPSEDTVGAVGAQPGRWTSYLPNGFLTNVASSRDLLLALSMILAQPLPVALRLHSISIYDVTDLGVYCIRNSISDATPEALSQLSSLLAADPEDEPTLRSFIIHAIAMVQDAQQKQKAPSTGDDVPMPDVEAPIATQAQRWCSRVKNIITTMNLPFVKREAECALLLLSLVAGENVFIHGPPGVAKSMLARRIFSFYDGKRDNSDFKIVLSRTTLPDELYGPVSLTAAKQDRFQRNISGHLPTAHLAFIDEIFNASSAVLNGLLSIINEKVYRNGTKEVPVPLHMVVGASTDFPSAALKPFFDRFLIRMHISRLSSDSEWGQLLDKRCRDPEASADPIVSPEEKVTDEILTYIRRCSRMAELTPRARRFLTILPRALSTAGKGGRVTDLSERRFFHAIGLLQTAATVRALAGGSFPCVTILDCALLQHILWEHPQDIPTIHRALIAALKETLSMSGETSLGGEDKRTLRLWWDLNPWQAAVNGRFGAFLRELIA